MNKCYVGIDPGITGGLAAIYIDGPKIKSVVRDMPVNALREIDVSAVKKFYYLLEETFDINFEEMFTVIEAQQAFSGQGVTSTHTNGKNYGRLTGILDVFNFVYERVHPRKWKNMFSLGKDKNKSVVTAERLFPSQKGKFTIVGPRGGITLRDGAAEALLMAEYGRRIYK